VKLEVWIESEKAPIGVLERADDKTLTFQYAADVASSGRLSLSMPVRDEPYGDAACVAYFGNLLFEGREHDHVVAAYGLDRDDVGGLLYHLGADCPGAVSVTPEGAGPGKCPGVFPDDYSRLTPDELREIVTSLHEHGRLPDETRDVSPVAGVQPKLALLRWESEFYIPRPGNKAPTTHILKVPRRREPFLTRYEAGLLSLAKELGLVVAETAYTTVDCANGPPVGAVISGRFDRVITENEITRVHCEDFCQALGLPRDLKYERDGARGARRFSMEAVGRIADAMAAPALFRLEFFRQTLFNLAVGNTDNHAKNGSILYEGGYGKLAPLYDVVPVTMDPGVTHRLAIELGGALYTEDVGVARLETAMRDLGFARPAFGGEWSRLIHRVADEGIPFLHRHGGKLLADGVAAQLLVLEEALGTDIGIPERDLYIRPTRDGD
jgi:serine/threonine-protein kinase HipA